MFVFASVIFCVGFFGDGDVHVDGKFTRGFRARRTTTEAVKGRKTEKVAMRVSMGQFFILFN